MTPAARRLANTIAVTADQAGIENGWRKAFAAVGVQLKEPDGTAPASRSAPTASRQRQPKTPQALADGWRNIHRKVGIGGRS